MCVPFVLRWHMIRGDGYGGRLGNGSSAAVVVDTPTLVEAVKGKAALQVHAGFWHSLVILQELEGDGEFTHRTAASEFTNVTSSTAESTHLQLHLPPWKEHLLYYPLMTAGQVYVFGSGMDGQLGLGPVSMASTPTRVAALPKRCADAIVNSGHVVAASACRCVQGIVTILLIVCVCVCVLAQGVVRGVFPVPLCSADASGTLIHVGQGCQRLPRPPRAGSKLRTVTPTTHVSLYPIPTGTYFTQGGS